jgi:hypothetical protein
MTQQRLQLICEAADSDFIVEDYLAGCLLPLAFASIYGTPH